jgi:hypothetical protein
VGRQKWAVAARILHDRGRYYACRGVGVEPNRRNDEDN